LHQKIQREGGSRKTIRPAPFSSTVRWTTHSLLGNPTCHLAPELSGE